MSPNIRYYVDLIIVLTQQEIKVRYKNSFMGFLWTLWLPLASALIYFTVFSSMLRTDIDNFGLFLIAGLFPWQWFANSVVISTMIFLGHNSALIKKVNFPRNLMPLVVVLQEGIHFILSLPIIIGFLYVYGKSPSHSWIYGIPILLSIQFLLTYGVSLIVSSINPFFRDMEKLISILIMLMFFLTPIVYSETMMSEDLRLLVRFNPVAPLVISWRNLILNGSIEFAYVLTSLFYALIIFAVGHLIYRQLSWRLAEVL